MSTPRFQKISFTQTQILAHLQDGRIITCPLDWFPRLQNASTSDREKYELSSGGIGAHWPALDEDLSAEGFLTYSPKPAIA